MPTNRIKSDLVTCPICRKWFAPLSSRTMPFCSERCRLIDLGKWASGGYVVSTPIMDPDEFEDAEQKLAEERRKSGDGEDSGRRH